MWKTLVPNTPRTLREILSTLIAQIIDALSSAVGERRSVAGRALGDVVKKLGERVLPEMVPFLRVKSATCTTPVLKRYCRCTGL